MPCVALAVRWPGTGGDAGPGQPALHHPMVPGPPLNGPTMPGVIQPP
jgi:hypothetical protein